MALSIMTKFLIPENPENLDEISLPALLWEK